MNEYLTPRMGFALLCVIIAASAGWLATAGRQALVAKPPAVPELSGSPDLIRFRQDAGYLPNDERLGFVAIEAGPAVLGSDPQVDRSAYSNERWSNSSFQGNVELPTYYIGRFEVTVAQYRAFVAATGRSFVPQSLSGPPTHPVTQVTWADALAYARWLDGELRKSESTPTPLASLLKDGWTVTLPTEAQWEKAARGGDGRIYPWGNTPDRQYANFSATHPVAVGSLKCPPCAYQLSDMSGNVWEFTRSPNVPYPFDPARVVAADTDALYVMRGGSFGDGANNIRAAIRGGVDPGARSPAIGFRLVISKGE